MFRKSLLLLSTVAILVPSVPSFADSKDERREKYRKESTAKPQAQRQQAQRQQAQRQRARQSEPRRERQRAAPQPRREQAAPQQRRQRQLAAPDRRDIASPNRAQRQAATRADRQPRADRQARNVRAQNTDGYRQRHAVVARADRERVRNVRETREARDRSVNRQDRPVRARTPDRRDVMQANKSFTNTKKRDVSRVPVNYGQRRHDGQQNWNGGRDRGRHVSSDNGRGRGNDHRSRGDHRDRDHNYRGNHNRYRDHDRGRKNGWHHRYRDRPKTRIYIGLGTNPYGYWGRPYYGHYSYSDWPFYSGYWHARSHWAWHTHHSHYHYGGYCPGLSHGYQASYHYDEPYYAGYSSNAGNEVAGTILGGVVGGILGSEIDGGRNRTAGIVIGSLLGATVGNSIAKSSNNSRTVSSNYRYTADYHDDDPTIYHYENEGYAPPREEVRKCIEYDVRGGNYVCRRWTVEYK
ncbi:glycine zipper 2TM domain-containing protein [Kordiimonas sp.]|uniref:glycine zipper 2TM domain-containing protein n=1 Tax=Kordiimonas sp. TaxID=1970157 RepID=UPI003A8EB81A